MDTFSKLMLFAGIILLLAGIVILIVQVKKHKKKLAGIICIGLAVLSFVGACSSEMFFNGGSPEEKLKVEVNSDISLYCLANYKDVKGVYADVTSIDEDGDYYYVYGVVTVNDLYNEKYYAKFEGKYRLSGDEFIKIKLSMDTPRKN